MIFLSEAACQNGPDDQSSPTVPDFSQDPGVQADANLAQEEPDIPDTLQAAYNQSLMPMPRRKQPPPTSPTSIGSDQQSLLLLLVRADPGLDRRSQRRQPDWRQDGSEAELCGRIDPGGHPPANRGVGLPESLPQSANRA